MSDVGSVSVEPQRRDGELTRVFKSKLGFTLEGFIKTLVDEATGWHFCVKARPDTGTPDVKEEAAHDRPALARARPAARSMGSMAKIE